jgi:spermidine/putrescine transport system permease protein
VEQKTTPYLLTLPSAIVFLAIFVAPFCYFFVVSFWSVDFYQLTPGFSPQNYIVAVRDYAGTGVFTVVLATSAALITMAHGFVYSFIARFKAGRWGQLLLLIVLVTLFGGYLMKIYAWKTILGNEGLLNTFLIGVGLIDRPISALLYSPGAVVVTLVHFSLPFAVLPIFASMRGIKDIEIEAAHDLGASSVDVLSTVIIPRCRNGLVTAFSFAFLITAGDYVTPALVGGKQTIIGSLIAPQFGNLFNWPLGSAMSFAMLGIAIIVIVVFSRLLNWWCRI